MPLELYNTLTREKELFKPVTPGRVGIYFCGPTVYSEPHLGHARGPIIFDVLKRWLQQQGFQVRLISCPSTVRFRHWCLCYPHL